MVALKLKEIRKFPFFVKKFHERRVCVCCWRHWKDRDRETGFKSRVVVRRLPKISLAFIKNAMNE